MHTYKRLLCSAFLLMAALFLPQVAAADIISISQAQTCAGHPTLCNGGNPFSLQSILNGTTQLMIADSQTPEWIVVNDTGQKITSLTLYFSGALASNADLTCQVNGFNPFDTCSVNGFSDGAGHHQGTDQALVSLPANLTWTQGATGTGLATGASFDIKTSSFAHAGADNGCVNGVSGCATVPEPSSVALLFPGLLAVAGAARLRLRR
jgi:hypothetical protein